MIIALILFNSKLYGQFSFGAKAGFTSSSIFISRIQVDQVNVNILQTNNLGTTFGILAKYVGEKHTGIQIELNYTQRGWTELLLDETEQFTTDLNYIDLATLSYFYVGKKSKKVNPIILAGTEINYFLNAVEEPFDPALEQEITYRATSENIRKILFGINAGAGANIDFPFGQIQMDFRFFIGFSNVFDSEMPDTPPFSQHQNLSVQVAYFPNLFKQKSTEP